MQSKIDTVSRKLSELVIRFCRYIADHPILRNSGSEVHSLLEWMRPIHEGSRKCRTKEIRSKFDWLRGNIDNSQYTYDMEKLLIKLVRLMKRQDETNKVPIVPLTQPRTLTILRNQCMVDVGLLVRAERDEIDILEVRADESRGGGRNLMIVEPALGPGGKQFFESVDWEDPNLECKVNEFARRLAEQSQ